MNGRGNPGSHTRHGYWGDSFVPGSEGAPTDWFTPVQEPQAATAVGVLDRPDATHRPSYPPNDYPSLPPGALEITANDVYEALGPQAEDLLATNEINIDELIEQINAETTVMPPLVIPDTVPEYDADSDDVPPRELVEAVSSWKRRFLKGAVAAAIISLTGTGGAAAAMDKSVDLNIDGQDHEVNTFDATVGQVLHDEGIQVGQHDELSPSLSAKVSHGGKITLNRGRLLKLTVDGQERDEWVHASTVQQALDQLGVNSKDAWISADRQLQVPDNGMNLEVKTSKAITLVDGANEPRQLTTHAVTVGELAKEQGLRLGPDDALSPGGEAKIANGVEVHIVRNGTTVINMTAPVDPPVQKIDDPNMLTGEQQVENPGTPGEKIVTLRVTTRNGHETGREQLSEKVTKDAQPKIVRVGTKQPPDSAVWDKLVQCEATGNWAINSGNGFYGGLQFDKTTWDAFGGDQYAAYPHQATREQQISVAEKVRDARGGSYGAWPMCAAKLGLPE